MHFADNDKSIDTIIYVLVVLGGILANVFRAYQRRKQQQESEANNPTFEPVNPEPQRQPYSPFSPEVPKEDIPVPTFEEMLRKLMEPQEREIVSREPEVEVEVEPAPIEVAPEPVPYIEAVKDSEIQPECAFEEATEDNLDFDLRKAVLFTEILKPKYIDSYY